MAAQQDSAAAQHDPVAAQPGGAASHRRNPAGAVYGTVVAGSLIAVESAADVDLARLTGTVLATLAIYWLAHTYSELVALHIEHERRPLRTELWEVLRDESAIVGASFDPIGVILLARLVGASERAAVLAGLCSIVLLLAGWALLAGRRSGLRTFELGLHVAAGTAFGCVIVLLEVVLH